MKTAKTAKATKTAKTTNSTKLNAAYGSNLSISQMAYRCPDAKIIGTGKINDYKLVFRYHAQLVHMFLSSCGN